MSHLVRYQAFNVSNQPISNVGQEVSFDGGNQFRSLTSAELSQGLSVEVDQAFVARVSLAHHFSVTQPLKVVVQDGEPRLTFDGAAVEGAMATAPLVDLSRGGTGLFVFSCWLSIFRDASASMTKAGNVPVAPFQHHLVAWSGPDVLASGGAGLGRFAASIAPNVPSHIPGQGTLVFGETPDSTVPQLAAIYVPDGLDLTAPDPLPVPVHIFFSPSTGGKTGPYPFSNGNGSFNSVFHNFLTSGGKRMINQHNSARRRCIFVFPLAPPSGYFDGIKNAARLRLYCLEAVHLARRLLGKRIMPIARLARCALSAFSEGGRPMNDVLVSSLAGNSFPELKEIYCLDTVSPAGSTTDAASYQTFVGTVSRWQAAAEDRHVRIYTQSTAWDSVAPQLMKKGPDRTNTGSKDYAAPSTTFVFTSFAFWQKVQSEPQGPPDPQYGYGDIHQLMPCLFLQPALRNSGFPSL